MLQLNKIVAVVVTCNRIGMLKQCIASLLIQTCKCDIIIVDNASSDNTEEWCKNIDNEFSQLKMKGEAHYFNTGQNLGGAGGFNYGMRKAAELGYEYVWIMDDDCVPFPNTLEKLMDAHVVLGGSDNYGFISSVVLWNDGGECKMNRQKIKKSYYEYVNLLKNGIMQVEQATFVSILFPIETVQKVGLPIKEFFIWGDDIEYTRRITVRNNLPSFMVGGSQVVHNMKENTGSNIDTDVPERIDRYKYAFRNEAYLYRKEGVKGVCYYIAKCGLNICRIIFKAKDHKIKRCCVLVGSMLRGIFFNPQTEYLD